MKIISKPKIFYPCIGGLLLIAVGVTVLIFLSPNKNNPHEKKPIDNNSNSNGVNSNNDSSDSNVDEEVQPIFDLPDGSLVYDVNDYKNITQGTKKLKLIVKTDPKAGNNELRVNFSDEGKNYKFKDGDFLEYDVYIDGSIYGTGIVDIVSGKSTYLIDQPTAYDQNAIKAGAAFNPSVFDTNDFNRLSDYATGKWYHRKIKIPPELIGKPLTRWDIVSINTPAGIEITALFDNICLTDGNGNIKYTAYSNGKLSKCVKIKYNDVVKYSLTPELIFPVEVRPYGDALRLSVVNASLSENKRATTEVKFSEAGSGKYSLMAGDSIVYKVRNLSPFVPGAGSVDIVFTDGTRLTDYNLLDSNGYSIKAMNDLSGITYGNWLYRKIDIKGNVVGKVISYWSFRTDNTISDSKYDVLYADIKIIRGSQTEVLAFGGGSYNCMETISSENAGADLFKIRSSGSIGKPSGDVLEQRLALMDNPQSSAYTAISNNEYVIKEGDCLEYDIKCDDIIGNSGFGVNLTFPVGSNVTLAGLTDQNGISALPGVDLTKYDSNKWYHRKIDLNNISGSVIKEWSVGGSINMPNSNKDEALRTMGVTVGGSTNMPISYATVFYDNIRITNKNNTVKTIYDNGIPAVNQITNSTNVYSTVLATTPFKPKIAKPPLNTVAKTILPTKDVPIITYNVMDFGAKCDGKTDDTNAFQSALFSTEQLGGGIVFAPAGRYAIKTHLIIPSGVTLRGEWQNPEDGGNGKGTILYAYEGKGSIYGSAFITMQSSSALTDISVFYPEQDPNSIAVYPWTIQNLEGMCADIENLTLYNSYLAIKLGPNKNGQQYIQNVYATPLRKGVECDNNYDILRLNNISLSPEIWKNSTMLNSPSGASLTKVQSYMNNNCEGIASGRCDLVEMYNISASYMKIALRFGDARNVSADSKTSGGAVSSVTGIKIDNAQVGIDFEFLADAGVNVTDGSVKASGGDNPVAIKAANYISQYFAFQGITLSSDKTIFEMDGKGRASFQNCKFESWDKQNGYAMDVRNGMVSAAGNSFAMDGPSIYLSSGCSGANITNNTFNGNPQIINETSLPTSGVDAKINIDQKPYTYMNVDNLSKLDFAATPRAVNNNVFDVTKAIYGAKGDGSTDDAQAIRKAISDANAAGGGTVYLPAGKYKVTGSLTLPKGVELCGAATSPFYSRFSPTVIQVYDGRGDANGSAFITLSQNAGVCGIAFQYPDQLEWSIVPYPYLIKGNGTGVYARNLTFINVYQGIDFSSDNCDGHFLENIQGTVLKTGLFIGNSKNGTIKNIQFISNFWNNYRSYGALPQNSDIFNDYIYKYQTANGTSFIFGNCENEKILGLYTSAQNTGIKFIEQNGKGCNATFINTMLNGPLVGMDILQAGTLNFVTSYLQVHQVFQDIRGAIKTAPGFNGTLNAFNSIGGFNGLATHTFYLQGGNINIQQWNSATGASQFTLYATGGRVCINNIWTNPPTQIWGNVKNPTDVYASIGVLSLAINNWIADKAGFTQVGDIEAGNFNQNNIIQQVMLG